MNSQSALKCLYIYDCRLTKHLSQIYTKGGITDSVLERYIDFKDSIAIITRMEYSNNTDKATLLTLQNLTFRPIKGLFFSKAFTIHLIYNLHIFAKEIKNADFIVTRLPSFLGIFGLLVNLIYKKKFFIEVAGDAQDALLNSRENPNLIFKVFTHSFFKINQFFIEHANGVIYVTKHALQNKYPTKAYQSYASNIEISIAEKAFTLESYKLQSSLVKIGLIGDYNNHYKGIIEAIQSIRELNIRGYNVSLTIVGSGSQLEYYRKLAAELNISHKIHFKGRLKGGREVLSWLETLDLYIQPSYTEGLPRALIEAMSVGLPAVASDVGGISELLAHTCLIPPKDTIALTNKLVELIESQKLRFKNGVRNYEVSKTYDKSILEERRKIFWNNCRDLVRHSK
ncbi:glycosyltransferase [Psychrobacter faecalis]|uniref:glycosyltransferase n=1 Tax=Psychrobacter faecalis TaxID=180588 RepID=UPI0018DF3EAE|nr:glycosyltransferase [Psychrobacter faecalis]